MTGGIIPDCAACDDRGKDPNGCRKCGKLGPAGRAATAAAARQRQNLTPQGRAEGVKAKQAKAVGKRGTRGRPVDPKKPDKK